MSLIFDIKKATSKGDHLKVVELTEQAIGEGLDPNEIIQEGFIPAMNEVGEKFGSGEIYVPEMLLAARAMKQGLEKVKPLLVDGQAKPSAKVVIGTVQGDRHDIGKNLVAMMLEGAGFEVIDLGVDVAPERFAEAVEVHKPDCIGLSALLTTTMTSMEETIEALKRNGTRGTVKILLGGAPVTQKFADEIGADGYGENAYEAVKLIKAMLWK